MNTAMTQSFLHYSNSSCDMIASPFVNMTQLADSSPWMCSFLWFHESIAALIAITSLLFIFATCCCCCCNCNYLVLFSALLITSPVWEVGVPFTLIAWCCCCRSNPQRTCCCFTLRGPGLGTQYTPTSVIVMPRIDEYTAINQENV